MDAFTAKLVAGGFLVANPAPDRRSGGVVRLWREGALDTPLPLALEKGKTHALECLDGGGYHYSCLLPSTYDPAKPTPVLVNFDPGGNARPLRPELADELGWIQVGLTESRNGPTWVTHENRDAAIFDLRRRFNVDPRRIYCSGFSGGARAASLTALFCPGMAAGLVLVGAAHTRYPPQKEIPIVYLVGESDMNRKEVEAAFAEDKKTGRASQLLLHPGGHEWGRKEDHEKALRWLAKETSAPGAAEKK
jgi:dienelactone hydrolase